MGLMGNRKSVAFVSAEGNEGIYINGKLFKHSESSEESLIEELLSAFGIRVESHISEWEWRKERGFYDGQFEWPDDISEIRLVSDS